MVCLTVSHGITVALGNMMSSRTRFVVEEDTPGTLDQLCNETAVCGFFQDERPLRNVLGHVDWRTGGQLSRYLLDGRVTGVVGEYVWVCTGCAGAFRRVLLVGLGLESQFDRERCIDTCTQLVQVINRCGVTRVVLSLPDFAGCDEHTSWASVAVDAITRDGTQEYVRLLQPMDAVQQSNRALRLSELRRSHAPTPPM